MYVCTNIVYIPVQTTSDHHVSNTEKKQWKNQAFVPKLRLSCLTLETIIAYIGYPTKTAYEIVPLQNVKTSLNWQLRFTHVTLLSCGVLKKYDFRRPKPPKTCSGISCLNKVEKGLFMDPPLDTVGKWLPWAIHWVSNHRQSVHGMGSRLIMYLLVVQCDPSNIYGYCPNT